MTFLEATNRTISIILSDSIDSAECWEDQREQKPQSNLGHLGKELNLGKAAEENHLSKWYFHILTWTFLGFFFFKFIYLFKWPLLPTWGLNSRPGDQESPALTAPAVSAVIFERLRSLYFQFSFTEVSNKSQRITRFISRDTIELQTHNYTVVYT